MGEREKPGMAPKVFTERMYVAVKKGEVMGLYLTKEQAALEGGKDGVRVYELAARFGLASPGSNADPRD